MKDLGWLANFIQKANWVIFILLGTTTLLFTDNFFFMGVVTGGIIVGINFHILNQTIQKYLNAKRIEQGHRSIVWSILVRYYIRFFVSAALIFILISNHWVHPLGLLTGLSVVVISIFLGTIVLVTGSLFKEAV